MKTITIHTLLIDTDSAFEVEVCLDKASLFRRLREIMQEYYAELEGNKEPWAKKCRAKWKPRINAIYKKENGDRNTWRAWKQFQTEEGAEALKGYEDHYGIGDHEIPLPDEITRTLQAADSSLSDYHRHLWHSNTKTRGGIQREAVIKTVKAIRKILGTTVTGQSL